MAVSLVVVMACGSGGQTNVPHEPTTTITEQTPMATSSPEPTCVPATEAPAQTSTPIPIASATMTPPTPIRPTATRPALRLPDGYSVYVTSEGCLPDGSCPLGAPHEVNYYWAPTRTSVVCPEESAWTLRHEACHAHQHLTILEELGTEPVFPYDLHEWDQTSEARTWNQLVTTVWPAVGQWAMTPPPQTALEDFAISCGLYFSDGWRLREIDPARYAALEAILG